MKKKNEFSLIISLESLINQSGSGVNLGVMAMKGYSTFPQIPGLEPHYCSNITDYFSTRKITTPWCRNTHILSHLE